MFYPELDAETRRWMAMEFDQEEAIGNPYRSVWLSPAGRRAFPIEMRTAITSGNGTSLSSAISFPAYWLPRRVIGSGRSTSLPAGYPNALALNEFNVWYTRGFARRLIEEGVDECVVYRAESATTPRCECTMLEGKVVPVRKVYDGHRARYHPAPGNPRAFSIPSGTNCHHSIKRVE